MHELSALLSCSNKLSEKPKICLDLDMAAKHRFDYILQGVQCKQGLGQKKKLIVSQALPHLFQMPLICLFFRLE